jgi:hypothetical protein
MTKQIVPAVDINSDDMKRYSREQGLDPEKWNFIRKSNGCHEIRRGAFGVGELIFEDHAKILVDALNAMSSAHGR